MNYDNGLYDRDLAEFDERELDDFVKRALFDELDKRDFDGDDINKRQAQAIIEVGEQIGKAIWKLVTGIKGQLDKEKDVRAVFPCILDRLMFIVFLKPTGTWKVHIYSGWKVMRRQT